MTTITKERLLKIQQWRETYGDRNNVILPAEEAAELARIALASMEAVPVYQVKYGADWRDVECVQYDDHAAHGSPVRIVYTAPPAPVVIDERASFDAWNNEDNLPIAGVGAKNAAWLAWQARSQLAFLPSPAQVVPHEIPLGLTSQIINLISSDLRDHNLTQRIWNACRAAMIATAPQQEASND